MFRLINGSVRSGRRDHPDEKTSHIHDHQIRDTYDHQIPDIPARSGRRNVGNRFSDRE